MPYEDEEGAKKASSEMDLEALTLEKDIKKSNCENNIDVVSTEDAKKASSEMDVKALRLE